MSERPIRRLLDGLSIVPWLLRHPTARRCPRCRLTWEGRAEMARMDGVCHDCWGADVWADVINPAGGGRINA